jgi:hypothetical protein
MVINITEIFKKYLHEVTTISLLQFFIVLHDKSATSLMFIEPTSWLAFHVGEFWSYENPHLNMNWLVP